MIVAGEKSKHIMISSSVKNMKTSTTTISSNLADIAKRGFRESPRRKEMARMKNVQPVQHYPRVSSRIVVTSLKNH